MMLRRLIWLITTSLFSIGMLVAVEPVIHVNVEYLAREHHWDEFLANWWSEVPDLSPLVATRWFWFCLGASLGIALALWVVRIFPERRSGAGTTTVPADDAAVVDYAYGLSLDGVQPSYDRQNQANTFEIRLLVRNASGAPIRIFVEKWETKFGNYFVASQNFEVIIPKDGSITLFPSGGFSRSIYNAIKTRSSGTLEYSIAYGHPDAKQFSRRSTKTLGITIFKRQASATVNYTTMQEKDEPISL